MEERDTYNTIDKDYSGLFKDKGSKFISYAYPVENEEQVKEIIHKLKKEHFSARHHCYAYRLGYSGEKYRYNDDGEPSGTAGRPIHGQLLSFDLTNILIVVVRYFGGTLLGVSGLINAYKNAASDVINNSRIVQKIVEDKFELLFDYPIQNQVQRILKEDHIEIVDSKFEMRCLYQIAIRINLMETVLKKLDTIEGLTVTKIE